MRGSQPLVSVLMPAYNSEKTLCRAMDSILNQTYKNIVVVVVEDGCTDTTVALLDDYVARDDRIKIYPNGENLGVARSLNRGIDLCEGKYIARMDADDFSYPERIEKQVAFMESREDVSILGSFRRIIYNDHSVVEERPCSDDEIKVELLFNIFASHPTVMLRTKDFKEHSDWRYPVTPTEDYDLFASLCTKVKFANIPEPLIDYYKSDEQATTLSSEAIRAANLRTSKETIKRELGINTDDMPDGYFGMRGVDALASDIPKHVIGAARLFRDMEEANSVSCKFDKVALSNILAKEWLHIKTIHHINNAESKYGNVTEADIIKCVTQMEDNPYPQGNIVVYGTGSYSQRIIPLLFPDIDGLNILAYCDSSPSKQGTEFLGVPTISPQELSAMNYDYVVISAPIYEKEIRENLVSNYKIAPNKIRSMTEIENIAFHKKRKLSVELFRNTNIAKRAFMFCSADYRNLGDHAIAYSESKFFSERLNAQVFEIGVNEYREIANIAKEHIKKDVMIVITGGGFLGSLWPNTEQMTRKVIREYPANPIIILPQTLYWEDSVRAQKEAEITRVVYEGHTNLTICARDVESLSLFRKYYPTCNVILVPDMVLSYEWNGLVISISDRRKGTLACLKNDKESILGQNEKNSIIALGEKLCGNTTVIDTVVKEFFPVSMREEQLKQKLYEFETARLCITDRLHGVIFSAISGTPCVALATCNHKLRESTKLLNYLPYIRFAQGIGDIERQANEVLAVSAPRFSNTELKKYYDCLETLLRNKIN